MSSGLQGHQHVHRHMCRQKINTHKIIFNKNLFCSYTVHPNHSFFFSIHSSQFLSLSPLNPRATLSFRKEQVSKRKQPNMTEQDTYKTKPNQPTKQ